MTTTNKGTPDKDYLYGRFEAGEAWKRRLHRKGAYKALDMADDDMGDIHANRIGMTWKELAVVAALLGGSVAGTAWFTGGEGKPSASPAAASPADSEYEVRFYDADGNPIRVEPINRQPPPTL